MKKLLYLLILPLALMNSSCSMMVKGLSKTVANKYDDHKDVSISDLLLTDKDGKEQKLSALYAGKVVYLYVWKHIPLLPPGDENEDYNGLKTRFAKYNDVVFINVYTGEKDSEWQEALVLKNKGVTAYKLSAKPENDEFKTLVGSASAAQLIGKDGRILGFNGPNPSNSVIVDYALDKARTGEDATKSSKTLIKGLNSDYNFKKPELTEWYTKHFGKKPDGKVAFRITSSSTSISN